MAYVESLEPEDKDCVLVIEGGVDRPPYEKFEGIAKLFDHAKACAAEIGFDLQDLKTGGGSDGNFTGCSRHPNTGWPLAQMDMAPTQTTSTYTIQVW